MKKFDNRIFENRLTILLWCHDCCLFTHIATLTSTTTTILQPLHRTTCC